MRQPRGRTAGEAPSVSQPNGHSPMTALFQWFNEWRRERTRRDADHRAAWAQEPDTDGVKPFQRAAQAQVDALLRRGEIATDWLLAREGGVALVGRAPARALEIWLYDDTFSFTVGKRGDYLEWWDYPTPDAMITAIAERIESALGHATTG